MKDRKPSLVWQKKFFTDLHSTQVVERWAEFWGVGFSEALRMIIEGFDVITSNTQPKRKGAK